MSDDAWAYEPPSVANVGFGAIEGLGEGRQGAVLTVELRDGSIYWTALTPDDLALIVRKALETAVTAGPTYREAIKTLLRTTAEEYRNG